MVTAHRRMGKAILARELLRRLEADGTCETVFVDLEDAVDPADAIVEIAIRSKPIDNAWRRIRMIGQNSAIGFYVNSCTFDDAAGQVSDASLGKCTRT